jgi:hypothetical protein
MLELQFIRFVFGDETTSKGEAKPVGMTEKGVY